MLIEDINEFFSLIPTKKRVLALDIGTKTIGLSISDFTYKIASSLLTIKRKKFTRDAEELIAIIHESDVGGLVVGLPINMDGSEGAKCQSVRQFVRNFLKIHDIPVAFHDERLSTCAAEGTLLEADMSRQKRKLVIDKVAASYILQPFLDKYNQQY